MLLLLLLLAVCLVFFRRSLMIHKFADAVAFDAVFVDVSFVLLWRLVNQWCCCLFVALAALMQ